MQGGGQLTPLKLALDAAVTRGDSGETYYKVGLPVLNRPGITLVTFVPKTLIKKK